MTSKRQISVVGRGVARFGHTHPTTFSVIFRPAYLDIPEFYKRKMKNLEKSLFFPLRDQKYHRANGDATWHPHTIC